ncbi:hypothetical protein ROLI_016130 [Roseobacter fucihabitans]|uniref:Uncharacterized protein n=1 Tax=Roseobacter fucihabitans TaxID=1537242 RepID=A0ABZ2BRC0_9RHOB
MISYCRLLSQKTGKSENAPGQNITKGMARITQASKRCDERLQQITRLAVLIDCTGGLQHVPCQNEVTGQDRQTG